MKTDPRDIKSEYNQNPLLKRYIFMIIFWVYLNIVCFFWMTREKRVPLGNPNNVSLFQSFFCPENAFNRKCRFADDNVAQGFYLINLLYLVFSALQIRSGKPHVKSFLMDFKSTFNKIGVLLYKSIPLVRETNALIEYSSIKTSMSFQDWF